MKKPTPEMITVRRWNLLVGASLRRSVTVRARDLAVQVLRHASAARPASPRDSARAHATLAGPGEHQAIQR